VASLGGSTASPNSSDAFVFNQSYGYSNSTDFQIDPALEAQYAYGTSTLRGGKGALYVKSAGNGFNAFGAKSCATFSIGVTCQNANFDPSNTLPYQIVMAAMNAKGKKSSYSTAGSAIWTSTPGGEYGYNAATAGAGLPAQAYDPAMVSTDQSNCAKGYSTSAETSSAFNQGGTNVGGVNASCNYTNGMNGTSSAAPMMSGVIALILEANPALTWREVKDILAKTAVQVDASNPGVTVTAGMTGASVATPYVAELPWTQNTAGFWFHNWYGFGAVNASAAVNMARTYVSGSLGTFANTGWIDSGTLALAIPDNNVAGASTTLAVPAIGVSNFVEVVQIQVTTTGDDGGGWTGDIAIELTAPSGTKSILKNIKDGFDGTNLAGMVLASNAFYGEPSTGNWTVKLVDGWTPDTQTLTNVKIRVYGH
jgi:subtilisin-like proprotein convertase family protein